MRDDEGKVYVTKIASAQRQLDTAIRMHFSGEDELAIHTVAAAAYRILRDLKAKRGRGELADLLSLGLFAYADDLVSGRLQNVPEFLARDGFKPAIEKIVEGMRRGEIKTYSDVQLSPNWLSERKHWTEFNKTTNFLKHSDRDQDQLLSASELNNDDLLVAAAVTYKELMGTWTPEMFVLGQLSYAESHYVPLERIGIAARLSATDPSSRRHVCLQIVDELKRGETCD
jgi:hypothetical protein